jgi:hypothetical protein
MAPGGVEPPHAASKAAALSTELRGLESSVSVSFLRLRGRLDLLLGRLALAELAASLRLGVDLGTD